VTLWILKLFSEFSAILTESALAAMLKVFEEYVSIAEKYHLPFIVTKPTWLLRC
jgi:hypothetical protein